MASTIRNTVIEFGTLAVPVALRKVSTKGEVNFDRACKDGAKVKRLEINADTGKAVTAEDIIRGVRDGDDGPFHEIPAEAIAAIEAQTKLDSLAISGFVPLDEIPWERVTGDYYLAPVKGQSSRGALKLLLEAMKPVYGPRGKVIRGARAGVTKLMPRSLQHLAIVYPKDDGLFVSTLVWAEDFRQAEEARSTLADVKVDEKALGMARELIDAYSEPIEHLDSLTDDVREKRAELIAQAALGKKIVAPKAVDTKGASDNLMAALEESLTRRKRKAAVAGD